MSVLVAVPERPKGTAALAAGAAGAEPLGTDAVVLNLAPRPLDMSELPSDAVVKALLGSVSQQLLLDSPVPVLAVKLPEDGS
jgi:hypothetical protein